MIVLKSSILSLLCLVMLSLSFASNPSGSELQPGAVTFEEPVPFARLTIQEFLELSPKKYRLLTGKKMSMTERLSLKVAQYKMKRFLKKNPHVSVTSMVPPADNNNFSILGFVLGLALGPLGVLIAYLLEGKSSSTFTWAIIGGLIWLGVFLLVVVIL